MPREPFPNFGDITIEWSWLTILERYPLAEKWEESTLPNAARACTWPHLKGGLVVQARYHACIGETAQQGRNVFLGDLNVVADRKHARLLPNKLTISICKF